MNPERWRQVREILDKALALDAADQKSYLDQSCASDAELRREVESLLASHQKADSVFLKNPAVNLLEMPELAAKVTNIGRRIGVYQILEEIGEGGMGEVYRAIRADGQYKKEVAIKMVRGGYDSKSILERFRHERQILASLDHPNIARLIDGATTEEGIPYLVMELIDGIPIDQYCDEHKLGVEDRLQLFRQVCGAVQYAHQRLVIHRDIKPSNILVTKEGTPKLLDFGIAKLLDPSAGPETTMARPMTPEYASPEQIRGETITTATDVYSLGVVLYRLLTGRSPYPGNAHTAHELARVICEVEPSRPSTAMLRPA
jgi:serine/threonine protein kinase